MPSGNSRLKKPCSTHFGVSGHFRGLSPKWRAKVRSILRKQKKRRGE